MTSADPSSISPPREVSRIQLLSPMVAEQIAAGEVIDRPAAVVRELVDNALDAGARRVDVSIVAGGRRQIRVVDDGRGMAPAQARLAFERHATSKLRELDDLLSTRTLGFRGEGLTSVAVVSKLRLCSRARDAEMGTELEVQGGKILAQRPVGCAVGTSVEVQELFYNVPARRKFLKSPATESALVSDVLERRALCCVPVRFELSMEGRPTLSVAPAEERRERVRSLLRLSGESMLSHRRGDAGLHVELHLAPLARAISSARGLRLIVNGRPIRDRALLAAVMRGLEGALEAGRYPQGVVYVDVDPAALDINVHPQKSEVRFAQPRRVFEFLKGAAGELGGGKGLETRPPGRGGPSGAGPEHRGAAAPAVRTYRLGGAGGTSAGEGRLGYVDQRARIREATRRFWADQPRQEEAEDFGLGAALAEAAESAVSAVSASGPRDTSGDSGGEASGGLQTVGTFRVLGRSAGGIVVVDSGDDLLLVDPLQAARRVLSRTLAEELEGGALGRRDLSPPLSLSEELARSCEAQPALLASLGFDIEDFGGAWVLRSIPRALGELAKEDITALLRELVDLTAGRDTGRPRAALELLARRAPVEALDDEALLAVLPRLGAGAALRPATEGAEGAPSLWRFSPPRRWARR